MWEPQEVDWWNYGNQPSQPSQPQQNSNLFAIPGNWTGFVIHHSGGLGTPQGVIDTLRQRGLGAQYVVDPSGNIVPTGLPSAHIRPPNVRSGTVGTDLSNRNSIGVEFIARNDKDITQAQIDAARRLYGLYPNATVYGHGQLDPGHKQPTEGMTIATALRGGAVQPTSTVATPAGNQPMPQRTVYDNRGAGMAGYGPVIPLPASPFQPGVGGGGGPQTVEPGPQGNDPISQMIRRLIANRQSGARGGGGVLGRALMMGLAGAASRVGGPAGGLVAGLASGLGSRMGNRGDEDYQRQVQALNLMLMQKKYEQEQAGTYTPYMQGFRHDIPGKMPHYDPAPEGYPQAPVPPQTIKKGEEVIVPDPNDPSGWRYAPPGGQAPVDQDELAKQQKLLADAQENFKKQVPAADYYSRAKPFYDAILASSQGKGFMSDYDLISGYWQLVRPNSTRFNAQTGQFEPGELPLPAELTRAINRFNSEGGLDTHTRYLIMKEARIRVNTYQKGYEEGRKGMSNQWKRFNLNPDEVAPPSQEYPEIQEKDIGGQPPLGSGGQELPKAATEEEVGKLGLRSGDGFIGPDGKVHYIP